MIPMLTEMLFGTDFIRWFVVIEMTILIYCGSYLLHGARGRLTRGLWPAGFAYGYVLLMVAAAVVVNAASPIPPTPGLRVFAVLAAPAVGAVAVITASVMRRG